VKRGAPTKLDLACGQNKTAGFWGVDIAKAPGVDQVVDLTKTPWPFKVASVEEVACNHFLEHLDGPQRVAFMEELYRVLKAGGKATIVTPYWASMRAVQDPTHKWPPVAESSYLYFNKGWRTANKLDHYAIRCDFDFTYGYNLPPEWTMKHQEVRDHAVRHYQNVVSDLIVTLTKREQS
jgi:SAM-dependent methyltransferase